MIGIGTLVNVGAIIIGGGLGLLFKKGIPERVQKIIFTATGTAVFIIGLMGVFTASITVGADGTISSKYILQMLLALVLGGIIGELLRLDKLFDKAGALMRRWFAGSGEKNGGEGFAQATILFCAGAMAIIGAIEDGASGNPTMLYTKAVLDGITALIFATVYGTGVLFSAVTVLLYQGGITLLAVFIAPYITQTVITQMSLCGSAILMLIAFSLWDIKKFNVANLIPATFMPILFSLIIKIF